MTKKKRTNASKKASVKPKNQDAMAAAAANEEAKLDDVFHSKESTIQSAMPTSGSVEDQTIVLNKVNGALPDKISVQEEQKVSPELDN